MQYFVNAFIFLLPFHAVFVTYLKCKLGFDTDILRFWKEGVILLLFFAVSVKILWKNNFNLKKIYKNNYILGLTTAFVITSLVYIYFPYFNPKVSSYLGFKYDVMFLLALIIGLYLPSIRNHLDSVFKSIFLSAGLGLAIFLPWYLFGDISSTSDIIGYSSKPSTYVANSCISFSQNVTGGYNRFQGSFADPIRFSAFMVVFYFMYIGFVLQKINNLLARSALLIIPSLFTFIAVFYSYTKTSLLGGVFGVVMFTYLVRKVILKKEISKKFVLVSSLIAGAILLSTLYVKRSLFLHPEAVLGRVEGLMMSIDMFFYNPIGYGLGIAGPASQLATSSDSSLSAGVNKFLPENWYIQILLEQGLLGLGLFVGILFVVGSYLYRIVKSKKDYLSTGIFVSYLTILLMANFTHVFEESATSLTFFLIIGAYIACKSKDFKNLT